jgi:hypothetical protein
VEWCDRIYQAPGIQSGSGISWGLTDALMPSAANISGYPGTGGLWTTSPLATWIAANYP